MPLTKRQKEVMDFLHDFVQENGYNPSYEELAGGLNLASVATVHKHISTLEKKQYLRRSHNQSRSLEVTAKYFQEQKKFGSKVVEMPGPGNAIEVPLLGRIAAGALVENVPSQATLSFGDFVGNSDTYALEVRGDSMIEDHICSGDYVLVERSTSVRNGDIVVAMVDGSESTLKRYYDEGERVRLQPSNSAMAPIFVSKSGLEIQGKVLAVLRKYRG
jgi:repressor LexA